MNPKSRNLRANLLLLCIGLQWCCIPVSTSRAQDNSERISIDVAENQLMFIRLPGQPDVNLGKENASGKTPIAATYMMSTELTAAVMKELVGKTEYDKYLRGLPLGKPSSPDHKLHKEKLDAAAADIAVCSVPMNQVFRCSGKLEQLVLQSGMVSEVETVQVRLPTSVEWKYAMLSKESLEGLQRFPRFPSWPSLEDVRRLIATDGNLKAYMSDLQEEDSSYTAEVFASQDKFAELIDKHSGSKKKLAGGKAIGKVLTEILGRFLLADTKLGLSGNPAIAKACQRDFDPRQGVANEFGLLNMYNNLSEWVVLENDGNDSIDVMWEKAIANPAESEMQFFAIGPSTFSKAAYQGAWRWMSLRDPYPESQTGKHKTLSYEVASDPDGIEYYESCRFLMVRKMHENWFAKMRSEFLLSKNQPASFEEFAKFVERSIGDVVEPGREFEQASSVLETYRVLADASGSSPQPLLPDFYKTASVGYIAGNKSNASETEKSDVPSVKIDLGDFGGAFGGSSLGADLKESLGGGDNDSKDTEANQTLDFFSIYRNLLDSESQAK